MRTTLILKNANSLLAEKYVSLKSSVLENFETYDKLIKEIRQLENAFQLVGITISQSRELSEIYSEVEKEIIYKKVWCKGISFNWQLDYYKPGLIDYFISELGYHPTPEVMGEVFCTAFREEPSNPAVYQYTLWALGKTRYLILTKEVAKDLPYCIEFTTWNEGEMLRSSVAARHISNSEQIYLYGQIEYRSLMHLGNVLKPQI